MKLLKITKHSYKCFRPCPIIPKLQDKVTCHVMDEVTTSLRDRIPFRIRDNPGETFNQIVVDLTWNLIDETH